MCKKHAYLIMAYNNIELLKVLMKQIDYEKNDIYIHLDKKNNSINEYELNGICQKSTVYVYKEIKIFWGDYSQTRCEIFLLEKAIKNDYSYYHLLSGTDLLIKNSKEIYDFFEKKEKGKEFIHFESDKLNKIKKEWYEKYHLLQKYLRNSNKIFINRIFKLLEKGILKIQYFFKINRNKHNIKHFSGANWFSITNDLAKYIISKKAEIEKDYKYTRSSDEIFLQTLVYNSTFKNNLYNNRFNNDYNSCMRFIDWNRGKPYTFKLEDYDMIINSNMMFARKFSQDDKELINKIYQYTNNIKGM